MAAVAAIVTLGSSCAAVDGVSTEVSARMERPEVTDRFADIDRSPSDDAADGDSETDDTAVGVEFREQLDPLANLRPSSFSESNDSSSDLADVVGFGRWTTPAEVSGGTLELVAQLELDLLELDDRQLAGLGIIDSADIDVPRDTRWFQVDGLLAWDLAATTCIPSPDVDSCVLEFATDGSIVGIAELNAGQLQVAMKWRELGRRLEPGLPLLVVEVTDASGFKHSYEVPDLQLSVEAAFVNWPLTIELDSGPQEFTSSGVDGSGVLSFSTN